MIVSIFAFWGCQKGINLDDVSIPNRSSQTNLAIQIAEEVGIMHNEGLDYCYSKLNAINNIEFVFEDSLKMLLDREIKLYADSYIASKRYDFSDVFCSNIDNNISVTLNKVFNDSLPTLIFQNRVQAMYYDSIISIVENELLSYNDVFGRHRVGIMAGVELRSTLVDQVSATTYGYFPDRGKNVTKPPLVVNGVENSIYNKMTTRIVDNMSNYFSLYGSATYSFDERYVFTASIRSDASNRFGQDRRARFLPVWSIGGRWNAHNETWMQNQKVFSELNMRASLGWQGNVAENFGPDLVAQLPTNVVNNVTGEYELKIKSLPYADLRWEKTRSLNVGFDMGLFRNRVMLSVEYYNKHSEDLIVYKDVPLSYGVEQMPINGGTMTNEGFELNLSTTLVRTQNFIWNISMNTAKNRNRIKSTLVPDGSWTSAVSGELNKEGYPVSAFWAFELVGLDHEYGTPIFNIPETIEDPEGQGDATSYMKYMGKMEPDFTGGLSMSFRYKNLSLLSSFNLSIGGKRFLHSLFQSKNFPYSLPAAYDNLSKEFVNRWREPGDELHTNIPAIPSYDEENTTNIKFPGTNIVANIYEMYDYSDVRVVNASFLRCNNISLTYNLPDAFLKYLGLENVAFSGSVSNPFMIVSKDYKGVDPEVATGGQPLSKVYSLRLNITF